MGFPTHEKKVQGSKFRILSLAIELNVAYKRFSFNFFSKARKNTRMWSKWQK